MFDSLINNLNYIPQYLPFYEALVFAANASSRLPALEAKVESIKDLSGIEKNYLIGLINFQNAEYKNAAKYFGECFEADSTNKYILYQLSYSYRGLGDYKKALQFIQDAKKYSDSDLNFKIKTILAEGSLYFLSGEYDAADAYYKMAYKISNENHLKEAEGNSLVALGIMDDIQGFTNNAREKYNDAVSIADKIKNIELKAYSRSELGVSFSYTNELIEAKENYLKSFDLYKQMGNKLRLSLLSDNIGKIYMTIFNYESAIKYYREGIELAGDNKRSQALNLTGLADAYSNLANYSEALKYYRQAQKLAAEINEVELKI